jgi:hydroxymethylbilane synthase
LAQTTIVLKLLRSSRKNLDFQVKSIKTEGDTIRAPRKSDSEDYNKKSSFTKTIDQALIDGEIDIAVHSLKDVPIEEENSKPNSSNDIEIAAFPKRDSPYDVLISKRQGDTLETLPRNARIGTSSVRRALQLKIFRPDFKIVQIRGNVQTRIEKLRSSKQLDAIVLASAGLKRLGIPTSIGKKIETRLMLPAVGQGCLAVAVRKRDRLVKSLVSRIDDKNTRIAVTAERAFSREVGGGCNMPVAALATLERRKLFLDGLIQSNNSKGTIVRARVSGSPGKPEFLGKKLAGQLMGFQTGRAST